MALGSNILLNLYAPLFIIIRLALHRRMMVSQLGPEAPVARYLRVVNILLQSAALNVPVMIIGTVGLALNLDFGAAFASIGITCQVRKQLAWT